MIFKIGGALTLAGLALMMKGTMNLAEEDQKVRENNQKQAQLQNAQQSCALLADESSDSDSGSDSDSDFELPLDSEEEIVLAEQQAKKNKK